MVHRAAPVAPQHAGRVRVVDHHDGAMPCGRFHQPRQWRDIAIHGKDAVRDQQLAARNAFEFRQNFIRRRRVLVRKNVNLRLRQTAAVDDARVVQLIGNNVIFRRENRRHRPRVGREPRLKHNASFHPLERRDALLQFHVQAHGAGNRPHRARPHAILARGFDGRLPQLRMGGQPEVVIGGQVDDILAVKARFRRALRFQHPQPLVRAFPLPLFQLIVKIRERIVHQLPV